MKKYFEGKLWLAYALIAALCWGIWSVLAKFISDDINPFVNHLLFSIGILFTIPLIITRCRRQDLNMKGIMLGIGGGLIGVTGNVAVYQAFKMGGLAAVVIPFTNLYPLVTILIAILILKERLNWINVIGIIVVVPAIVILSGQTQIFTDPASFFRDSHMNSWIIFALVSLVCWGVFSAGQKVTTNHISAEWSYLTFIVSCAILSVFFLFAGIADFNFSVKTLAAGSAAGLFNGLGVLAVFSAYKVQGKASKVPVIAAALEPVFTIILAITFLGERLTIVELSGISLAIAASVLLSVEKINEHGQNA